MKKYGVMLDCSRNAVMNIASLKKYIDILSKMGYNQLLLYTEDTYEIPSEPYFGYLRGRYSLEEIKEIDKYAISKKIELVPCIQTLAHLNAIFRWNSYGKINDCNDILLIDDEKTYELIDKMFETVSSCYSSRTINIGMDEAHMMGLGKYLLENGYHDRNEIFLRHLNKVVDIANKYGFKCMMWSDMFYRMASKGEYYETNVLINDKIKKMVPQNVSLVYWDYYHKDKQTYDLMIKGHQQFNNEIYFAGGSWTWTGFAPQNKYAIEVIKPAMQSCVENNIEHIFITQWKDNGGECSFFSSLPALFYAIEVAKNITDIDQIKKDFHNLFQIKFDDFMKFDLVNVMDNKSCADTILNPSKYMLYSDPFLGICDSTILEGESNIYIKYSKMYQNLKNKMPEYDYLCTYFKSLCDVLKYKYELGLKTRKAYVSKDKAMLKEVINEYTLTIKALKKFISIFRKTWYIENKPHGFDVQDIRLGGLLMRLESCKERLIDFSIGNISKIEELEEELLDLDGVSGKKHRKITEGINNYQFNATVNVL